MRYAPEHKEGTRARLVKATGALAKRQGFSGTGIDGLMAAAGLTSGAFYAHFRSKNELLEAIVDNELQRSVALFAQQSPATAMKVIEGYLSPAHVAHPESGCAVPALAPEIARADAATQQAFERGVLALKEQLRTLTGDDARAWSLMAQLVGAVMLARGLPSESTQQALLDSVLQQVRRLVDDAPDEAGRAENTE